MSFIFGTRFVETEALLAAQQEDYAALADLLDQMTPTEIVELWHAADRLRVAALAAMRAQTPTHTAQGFIASTTVPGA